MPLFQKASDLYDRIAKDLEKWSLTAVPATEKMGDHPPIKANTFSLWKTPDGETVVVLLINTTLTGSERNKPQIRIFTEKAQQAYCYAKAQGLRYFFFVYCTTPAKVLKFSPAFDPSHYIVSIESRLTGATGGRLDIRSMYDRVEQHGKPGFLRVTEQMHNCDNLTQAAFIPICDESGGFSVESLKGYLQYFDSRPYMLDAQAGSRPVYTPSVLYQPTSSPSEMPWNLLVHGAPGTGKSFFLDKKVEEWKEDVTMRRVTFYEDYSYGQFVGEYMPVPVADTAQTVDIQCGDGPIWGTISGEHISYRFSPGPLAELLAESFAAKLNGEKTRFVLIIEELNRANAASVFGDIFQLLDRRDGVSIYEIDAQAKLAEYLYVAVSGKLKPGAAELPEDAFAKLRLPDNLYIWATMNSADQGVFPLDSAFKRRWSYIYRDIYSVDPANARRPLICLPRFDEVTNRLVAFQADWNTFRCAINEKILAAGFAEDRCVGYWFFSEEELRDVEAHTKASVEARNDTAGKTCSDIPDPLVDKLFAYLLQDVFRNVPADFFRGGLTALSQVRLALETLRLGGEPAGLEKMIDLPVEAYVPHPQHGGDRRYG